VSSFIVSIDQGSSATKVLAFDHEGQQTYRSSRSLKIDRPQPNHVEQDPVHVLEETRAALEEVISSIDADGHEILSIGLACQRSSFILWDRRKGKAFTPIISWQDLRAQDLCAELTSQREMIYGKTGLPLTGHYGGPKFLWLLQNRPEISQWIHLPEFVFSPWNSYLLWHLTEERICATDESIAGRTLFFNIDRRRWDQTLLDLFKIPETILPETWPTCHLYGHYRFKNNSIPIHCSIGDHQGALLGLGGFERGQCGVNYGTSAGVLTNIGSTPHIVNGLLTSVAYSTRHEVVYTAEGTVNAVGSLFEWFEREKGIAGASIHWDEQVASSSQGWTMIPGMYGIAAPYWKETAPTEFRGEGVTPSQEILLRAGMESIAFFVADILEQLRKIPRLQIHQITAAGGVARRPLLQFQADLLGVPIRHSSITDATALGCAFLTGLRIGFWKDKREIQDLVKGEETFFPRISSPQRQALLNQWHELLRDKGIFS
jgi:glycerol kinase